MLRGMFPPDVSDEVARQLERYHLDVETTKMENQVLCLQNRAARTLCPKDRVLILQQADLLAQYVSISKLRLQT